MEIFGIILLIIIIIAALLFTIGTVLFFKLDKEVDKILQEFNEEGNNCEHNYNVRARFDEDKEHIIINIKCDKCQKEVEKELFKNEK